MSPALKWRGEWHPLAARFPMLDEPELREMASSIVEHGQFVPCRMSVDGLGLDGRNRVAACALVDVEPRWEVYDGDAVTFIVEVNSERRHLTTGQRAMATAIGLAEAGKRRNGRFEDGSVPAADRTGASRGRWRDAVRQAGLVLDHAPELEDAVLRGEVALDAAHKQADVVRRQKDRVAALGGELATLVDTGVIDLNEAERRADETRRVDVLPDDLANRVRAETLSLDEAEVIAREAAQRIAAWAQQVVVALDVLSRMAGYPVPVAMAEHLNDDQSARLDAVLAALPPNEEVDV